MTAISHIWGAVPGKWPWAQNSIILELFAQHAHTHVDVTGEARKVLEAEGSHIGDTNPNHMSYK